MKNVQEILYNGTPLRVFGVNVNATPDGDCIEYKWEFVSETKTIVVLFSASSDYGRAVFENSRPCAVYDAALDCGGNGRVHFVMDRADGLNDDGTARVDRSPFIEHAERVLERPHTVNEAHLVLLSLQENEQRQGKESATTPSNAKPATAKASAETAQPAFASPTPELEAEIIRILNRDFPNTKKTPTFSQFYQENVINGRTMTGLARAKGWKLRTMHERVKVMKAHLTRKLGIPVDLNALRTAHRKSGRIVYTDPGVIERTHGNDTRRHED